MSFACRLLMAGLLGAGITTATIAQAGNQLFEGSWTVKAFGNECSDLVDPTPGPHCGGGWSESDIYSAVGLPQGIQCNADQPRCPFESTPTDGYGNFNPFGQGPYGSLPCAPWANWQGMGTTVRPAKGGTAKGTSGRIVPPLYRNPQFFTSAGQPNTTFCTAASTGATPGGRGLVQAGNPVNGLWSVATTSAPNGALTFGPAPVGAGGIRTTNQAGQLSAIYGSYTYRYTYATLRNGSGFFGPASGPGSFNVVHPRDASIHVKQGSAKFGGTMRMLGALTSKVCYFRNGGCSLGTPNWRYDAIGASAVTSNGDVIAGYLATAKAYYYHTALMQISTVDIEGSRFPWTTGSVTVTATGRGPHKTVHYAQGFDNRHATFSGSSRGTIQLVTPTLTRWLQPAVNFETGGIGIFKLKIIGGDCGDCDGVPDLLDNCYETHNPAQDDTDNDGCGNLCDANYDQGGLVGFGDFGAFMQNFGTTNQLYNHTEPVDDVVGFGDFGFYTANFGLAPGPSGTTNGTVACP
jgi:hypothetical protein